MGTRMLGLPAPGQKPPSSYFLTQSLLPCVDGKSLSVIEPLVQCSLKEGNFQNKKGTLKGD